MGNYEEKKYLARSFEEVFVFEPQSVSDDVVAQANKKRPDDRAFLPIEKALKQARKTKGNNRAKLIALAVHPDERVPLALLLENPSFDAEKINWQLAVQAVAWAAHQRASRTDVLWNPVFDAVAVKAPVIWTQHRFERFATRGVKIKRQARFGYIKGVYTQINPKPAADDPWLTELAEADHTNEGFLDYGRRARLVKEYIANGPLGDEQAAKLLTDFKGSKIHKIVGQHTNWEWDAAKVRQWMTGRPGLIAGVLEQRAGKPQEPWAIKEVFSCLAAISSKSEAAHSFWSEVDTLEIASREGWRTMQQLFTESLRGDSWRNRMPLLSAMNRAANLLNEAQLRELFQNLQVANYGGLHPTWYYSISQAPKASVQLLLDILDISQSPHLWERVAKHPNARDEAVVARMAKSQNQKVVKEIAPKASGEVFAGMVKRAMKRSGSQGVEVIETRSDAGEHLEPQVMKPAFLDQDKNVRLKAAMLAGKMTPKNTKRGI